MAQHHTVVVEMMIYITKQKGVEMPMNMEEQEYDDFSLYSVGEWQKVSETEESETFKAECTVARSITTSDEEYKVFKLIDWDYGDYDYNTGIEISFDTKERFKVIDDDSFWVEDEELDSVDEESEELPINEGSADETGH